MASNKAKEAFRRLGGRLHPSTLDLAHKSVGRLLVVTGATLLTMHPDPVVATEGVQVLTGVVRIAEETIRRRIIQRVEAER